jgi:6-pyruvoyltetrahydropterin/6-carboxytetrahydropterin synthase
MSIVAIRHHDFCAGHRVYGHEGKCAHLHGHGYRVHFHVSAVDLDSVGRVLDFSAIKDKLCNWLEVNWDHRMLIWEKDPLYGALYELDDSVVPVSFNPTAENLANHLLYQVGPSQLAGSGTVLVKVIVEETRKCSTSAALEVSL